MLKDRFQAAVVLLLLLSVVLLLGSYVLVAASLAAYFVVNYEFLTFATKLPRPKVITLTVLSLAMPIAVLVGEWFWLALVMAVFIGVILFSCVVVSEQQANIRLDVMTPYLLAVIYTGFLGSMLVAAGNMPDGNIIVSWLFLVTILTDTFAYLGGKTIGGLRISRIISPNKTVAGCLLGLVGGLLGSVIAGVALGLHVHIFPLLIYGLGASVLVQIGDMVESMFKRIYQVKDASSLIPGHGGLLDRIDGLMFACPVLFVLDLV